jgi:hypothetical protein
MNSEATNGFFAYHTTLLSFHSAPPRRSGTVPITRAASINTF